jgi:hypothetical protein
VIGVTAPTAAPYNAPDRVVGVVIDVIHAGLFDPRIDPLEEPAGAPCRQRFGVGPQSDASVKAEDSAVDPAPTWSLFEPGAPSTDEVPLAPSPAGAGDATAGWYLVSALPPRLGTRHALTTAAAAARPTRRAGYSPERVDRMPPIDFCIHVDPRARLGTLAQPLRHWFGTPKRSVPQATLPAGCAD